MVAQKVGEIWRGRTQLYIILDIGNTSSAVAYLYLQQDCPIPAIQNVNSWPGRRDEIKMPSTVLVSEDLEILRFGRDALSADGTVEHAFLVRNFKLALHPAHLQDQTVEQLKQEDDVEPSTFEKPDVSYGLLKTIYKAFIKCLLDCTMEFFSETEEDGREVWAQVIGNAVFTVGAPNGWLDPQKAVLGEALLNSGYCTSEEQVITVSEGEASFYYLLNLASRPIPRETGVQFLVADCGGSTIDCNVLEMLDADKVTFKEVGAPYCWQKGGLYVTQALLRHVRYAMLGSLSAQDMKNALKTVEKSFEEQTKTFWDGASIDDVAIECGPYGLHAPGSRILHGKFMISPHILNSIFDQCVDVIVERIVEIVEGSRTPDGKKTTRNNKKRKVETMPKIKHVLLVGGFGESKYLRGRLEASLTPLGVALYKTPPSHPGTKAVSAGGAWAHLEQGTLASRGALFHFGVESSIPYSAKQHPGRPFVIQADGKKFVDDLFHPIGQPSKPDQFSVFTFQQTLAQPPRLDDFSIAVYACTRAGTPPKYMRHATEDRRLLPEFVHIGIITWGKDEEAELQARPCVGEGGKVFYKLDYQIGVAFGGLRFQARIEAPNKTSKGATLTFAAVLDE